MRYLSGAEHDEAWAWIQRAAKVAERATCGRSKCGSLIVRDGEVIGEGFNSPPGDLESQRRCGIDKDTLSARFKSDKTCCVHAEQRALMDALRRNPTKLKGSRLYFIRLGEDGQPIQAGEPYCTICSKMTLDAGVAEFVLWQDKGIAVYPTDEYNELSFKY